MRLAGFALLATVVLAGCAAPETTPSSEAGFGFDPAGFSTPCVDSSGVTESPGAFDYGGAVSCKTAEEAHEWSNAAPRASLAWGGAAVEGKLSGTVEDAAGNEVYAFEIDGAGASGADGETDLGLPANPVTGNWVIRLTFTEFTGTMGLALRSV